MMSQYMWHCSNATPYLVCGYSEETVFRGAQPSPFSKLSTLSSPWEASPDPSGAGCQLPVQLSVYSAFTLNTGVHQPVTGSLCAWLFPSATARSSQLNSTPYTDIIPSHLWCAVCALAVLETTSGVRASQVRHWAISSSCFQVFVWIHILISFEKFVTLFSL